jgi:hypothetical protein
MITVGPIPKISIDFLTGSVVVPGVFDTMAISCPVSLLISLRQDSRGVSLKNVHWLNL